MIVFSYTNAQRPRTGQWYGLSLAVNFSKHGQWHNDGGYRTLGTSVIPFQYLYRTGLRYNFNTKLNAAAGIAFFFTKTDFDKSHHEFGNEFRLWEETNYQHSLNSKFQLLFRLRTEQRFFAETSSKQKYTAHRFRIRSGFNQGLSEKWSLQFAHEYMRQLANQKFSFDQNRIIFSGMYHFTKSAQLQAAYIWIKWPDTGQHILNLTFVKTISLHDH